MFAMPANTNSHDIDLTIPDKKTMMLQLSNNIEVFRIATDGQHHIEADSYLTAARTMLILTDVLVRHTSASRKGKQTATEIVSDLKLIEPVNDVYYLPISLMARIDWLMEYVTDKSDEFTARQLHECIVRINALTYMGGPAA